MNKGKSLKKIKIPFDFKKLRGVPLLRRKRFAFSICRGFYLYLCCLACGLFFTQTLKSSLSNMLFAFLLLFPFVSLIYLFFAPRAIRIQVSTSSPTVEKLSPADYEILLQNSSPLPFPFVDVYCTVPAENTVRCIEKKRILPLNPFCKCRIQNSLRFKYRGNYEIGVTDILVYDFFKMFRIRLNINKICNLCVLPRRLYIEGNSLSTPSEQSRDNRLPTHGLEQAEMREVRPYKIGDTPKSIHWKLSFKTEELQVRHFIPNPEQKTLILCDLSGFFDPFSATPSDELALPEYAEDMNEFCTDAITEMTTAIILRELRNGSVCRLVWFDGRSMAGYYDCLLESPAEFHAIFPRFASAPLCPPELPVARLLREIPDNQIASVIVVTASLSPEAVADLSSLSVSNALSGIPTEILFFNPTQRYKNREERRREVDLRKKQLSEHGFAIAEWEGELTA